jgi:hypothetical protein
MALINTRADPGHAVWAPGVKVYLFWHDRGKYSRASRASTPPGRLLLLFNQGFLPDTPTPLLSTWYHSTTTTGLSAPAMTALVLLTWYISTTTATSYLVCQQLSEGQVPQVELEMGSQQ